MRGILEWLKAIGVVLKSIGPFFAGLVALLIALFHEDYRRWRFKPKLAASINTSSPCCIKASRVLVGTGSVARTHYCLRIRITNDGRTEAHDVEVFAKNLERKNGHGSFKSVPDFVGAYLTWSHSQQIALDTLNPGMPKHCDLARVFCKDELPAAVFSHIGPPAEDYLGDRTVLDLNPQSGSWGQVFGPGIYRLTIVLGAANAKPIERIVQIKVTGTWPGVDSQPVNQVLDVGML